MKSKIYFLLKNYAYWIVLSLLAKVFFLCYQWNQTATLTGSDIFHVFWKGIRMDLSLGGYVLLLVSVVMLFSLFLKAKGMRRIYNIFTFVITLFFWGVVMVDLELFNNWGFHLDTMPLSYLKTPAAVFASVPTKLLFLALTGYILVVGMSMYCYNRWVLRKLEYKYSYYVEGIVYLLIGGAMMIPIRGGFNVAPMNSGFVYFHPTNMYANQCAVNPVWNFIYELAHINKTKKNYSYYTQEEAATVLSELKHSDKSSLRILNTPRPNIVFLLLESFTANAIEVMGGAPGVTPSINALAKEGILFDRVYATAGRSDRGLVAAISGIPSHPDIAVIKNANKMVKYPRFSKDLEALGYNTHFYYAGDLNFGSFRSYITMSFQDVVTEDNFSGEAIEKRFKWGVHDEYMFDRLYNDIAAQKATPFLYMAFNMSSHEPFEVPMETVIAGDDTEHRFMNAIYYSDKQIGRFVERCKASGIWDNTLFILMADHGTRHIGQMGPTSPGMYRIPLIFSGGALAIRDTVINTIGSQTDMIATLFEQMGIDYASYSFSRNLLSDTIAHEQAFFCYPEAATLVTATDTLTMDLKTHKFNKEVVDVQDERFFKGFLQSVDKVTKEDKL